MCAINASLGPMHSLDMPVSTVAKNVIARCTMSNLPPKEIRLDMGRNITELNISMVSLSLSCKSSCKVFCKKVPIYESGIKVGIYKKSGNQKNS